MAVKVLKKIGGVLAGILTVVEILLILYVIVSSVGGKTPMIFGYQISHIVTPSMAPEINAGDVIISKRYDGGELKVGDVVTYIGKEGSYAGKSITHKIIAIDNDEVITKGIANNAADPAITKSDIVSVMVYKTVVFDKIYKIISSTWGFVLILVVPLAAMIVSEVLELRRHIKEEIKGEIDNEEDVKAE